MNTPIGPKNIAFDIGLSRNSIIDNFILSQLHFRFCIYGSHALAGFVFLGLSRQIQLSI